MYSVFTAKIHYNDWENDMSPFERKFGRYAIRNLSFVLVICYAVGYVLQLLDRSNSLLLYLTLDPYAILHGQVWRLVTWILIPPPSGNILLTLIMLYFYCSIGTTLERTWGTYFSCGRDSGCRPGLLFPDHIAVFQHILHQYVDLSGFCGDFSGCSGAFDADHTDQGQMAWNHLCRHAAV